VIPPLSNFAVRLRELIQFRRTGASSLYKVSNGFGAPPSGGPDRVNAELQTQDFPSSVDLDQTFNELALELFALQFAHNSAYRKICETRSSAPNTLTHWTQIPAVPASAFKELDLSCLPIDARTKVFHSSGTTAQRPSRHFHSTESLAVYEASSWSWFRERMLSDKLQSGEAGQLIILTPPGTKAPNSSLVHMFEIIRRERGTPESAFVGAVAGDGVWTLDFDAVSSSLANSVQHARPVMLLGTAFSFVHLLDFLAGQDLRFDLPPGSQVMETGGYKGRSRAIPKSELHSLITDRLGIPAKQIVCEYGMSELSSQAYDRKLPDSNSQLSTGPERVFRFPPWARFQVVSPETGKEIAEGATGLLRICDLANVFSVMAIQTEDLAVRRGAGFELLGRAQLAEQRGCSLMSLESKLETRNSQFP
jgi:Acyl-protein synthetase, LuxE